MRDTGIKVGVVASVAVTVAVLIDREFAYRWLISMIGLGVLVLTAVSLPIALTRNRGYSFVGALVFIFIGMSLDAMFRWGFLAFNRVPWVFNNFVYVSYVGLAILAGGILQYVDTAGHMTRSIMRYRFYLLMIVLLSGVASYATRFL